MSSMLPSEIVLPENSFGILTGTMGKSEREAAACVVIRYHHAHDLDDWEPVSMMMLADLLKEDQIVQRWAGNPFWRPDFFALQEAGFISGWVEGDPNSYALITPAFLDALKGSIWDRRPR